ncbi:hypothetical protein AVEN_129659-1 [Araneus ventricosus]|uniref:Secreted protein n=1 Tax=Araneus ventricosus TaxID=182803 RepID=A0A4Y2LGD9_ARAVE|nr:hypothetical protein AVEN_102675-1 [Araneus ventricosus]GBN13168.1 hypothetical protein AVEN_245768-1 [Araneus ventricosus]GBN13215.1 hypothetical protein AVEN_70293-1 [Araneus ventricosus]GBN13230.1 hypothetical protein AVEN_129659-1 [Araneus ventricosus]
MLNAMAMQCRWQLSTLAMVVVCHDTLLISRIPTTSSRRVSDLGSHAHGKKQLATLSSPNDQRSRRCTGAGVSGSAPPCVKMTVCSAYRVVVRKGVCNSVA